LKQREKYDLKLDEIIVNSGLFMYVLAQWSVHQTISLLNSVSYSVAGSETTANALSGLFARLLYNPDKYKKLAEEIRSTFQSEDQIKYEPLLAMPYLNACIEEGLRIHPPVPTGLLRTVPKGGDTIDGYWVPEGTSVAVGGWAASHNPKNFVDPDSFIPERWLGDPLPGDNRKGMQPFSLGPRGCIGKQ
jgi:cytochrome P450